MIKQLAVPLMRRRVLRIDDDRLLILGFSGAKIPGVYCCQPERGVSFGECAVERERARRRCLGLCQHVWWRRIGLLRKDRQSDRESRICARKARVAGDTFLEMGERAAEIRRPAQIPEVTSAQERIVRVDVLGAVRCRRQCGGAATELEL